MGPRNDDRAFDPAIAEALTRAWMSGAPMSEIETICKCSGGDLAPKPTAPKTLAETLEDLATTFVTDVLEAVNASKRRKPKGQPSAYSSKSKKGAKR